MLDIIKIVLYYCSTKLLLMKIDGCHLGTIEKLFSRGKNKLAAIYLSISPYLRVKSAPLKLASTNLKAASEYLNICVVLARKLVVLNV